MPDMPVAIPTTTIWGRPATEPGAGWAVIDVETSGFRPGNARVISLAVLALDGDGQVEQSVVSLLNPGVDPGPTHVHGLTAAMLEISRNSPTSSVTWSRCCAAKRSWRTTSRSTTHSWPPRPRSPEPNYPSTP